MKRISRTRLLLLLLVALIAAAVAVRAAVPSVEPCKNKCSDNGVCKDGVCQCHAGFSGPDCSTACPNLCSGNGRCSSGKCICEPGFGGDSCSTLLHPCPRSSFDHPELECSGHGACDRATGTCVCRQGYAGKDCSIDDGSCGSLHCSNHGRCHSGQCICDPGFSGPHCEKQDTCPDDCNDAGLCIGGKCACFPGFVGDDCKQKDKSTCPNDCSANGICSKGRCHCSMGFSGKDCSTFDKYAQPFCQAGANKCSNHGTCSHNRCFCEPGYYGDYCQHQGCEGGCDEKHGHCVFGECKCQPGWSGKDCSIEAECPRDCSGHGACVKGKCSCEPYYDGEDCSKLTLPSLPCPRGLPSPSSSEEESKSCSGHGVCFLGQCFCEPSFTGQDCSLPKRAASLASTSKDRSESAFSCPNGCGGPSRGQCRFNQCFCAPGYSGADCSIELGCSAGCNKNGVCIKGVCKCSVGWTGVDCMERASAKEIQNRLESDLIASVVARASDPEQAVPRSICGDLGKSCSDHGLCIGSKCMCEAGWGGKDCGTPSPGSSSPTCTPPATKKDDGKDASKEEKKSDDESKAVTPASEDTPICSNHGSCLFGSCVCLPGWSGPQCEKPTFLPCPNDCSRHGLCYLGQCQCNPGFEGEDCSRVKQCRGGCGGHGVCVQGVCECVYGWSGETCSEAIPAKELQPKDYLNHEGLRTCGENGCGNHGVCLAHQCVCVEGFTGKLCDIPQPRFVPRPSSQPTPAHPAVKDIYGEKDCSVNCGSRGVCVGGSCNCVDGWAGIQCNIRVKPVGVTGPVPKSTDFLAVLASHEKHGKEAVATMSKTLYPEDELAQAAALKKPSTIDSPITPATPSTSLLESESIADEDIEVVQHRTTAFLADDPTLHSSASASSSASPSATRQPSLGIDPQVLAPNQVNMAEGQEAPPSYTSSINPFLLSTLCFTTGVLLTLAIRGVLDKRDQEKRKMKKMEELLQPAH